MLNIIYLDNYQCEMLKGSDSGVVVILMINQKIDWSVYFLSEF